MRSQFVPTKSFGSWSRKGQLGAIVYNTTTYIAIHIIAAQIVFLTDIVGSNDSTSHKE